MSGNLFETVHGYFLVRYGLFFEFPDICHVEKGSPACTDTHLQALDLMLAERYNIFLSQSLRDYLSGFGVDGVSSFWTWFKQLWFDARKSIKDKKAMIPLMSNFPDNLPDNLDDLWISRVLTIFQMETCPCNVCGNNTLVELEPCHHLVCTNCFSGYTGCPVCGTPIDKHSTFLSSARQIDTLDKDAWGPMRRLDLGHDITAFAKERFLALCNVPQALSMEDQELLNVIVEGYHDQLEEWLDVKFASKQVQALVLGAIARREQTPKTVELLRRHLKNATDVLRMIAVLSGEDGTLMPHKVHRALSYEQFTQIRGHLSKSSLYCYECQDENRLKNFKCICVSELSYQFKVTKMSRAERRLYLSILESMDKNALCEDLLRHRALWVRVGEFLHPGEYKKRFPKVAEAFEIIRKKDVAGHKAPKFRTWRSKFEKAIIVRDSDALNGMIKQRPGESARHLDRLLRGFVDADDMHDFVADRVQTMKSQFVTNIKKRRTILNTVLDLFKEAKKSVTRAKNAVTTRYGYIWAFSECIDKLSTPMLIQLWGHFGGRREKQKKRIFYPAGSSRLVYWRDDSRPTISPIFTNILRKEIVETLITRFETRKHFDQAVIDDSLRTLTFPFGERTNRSDAIHVSPGSSLLMPPESDKGKLRLFLHWCEKPKSRRVDLDLSVAFYNEDWQLVNGCTYYNLASEQTVQNGDKCRYATHSGDFQAAMYPNGATEYIDLDRQKARTVGVRYAVMLVTVYAGVDFNELERAYVGIMYRNELRNAAVFDPQTVRYKYALTGETNAFIPFVFDLTDESIHDIQCYVNSNGKLCNLDSNERLICALARTSMEFYASKPRPMRYDIALMQAAARTDHVWIRCSDGAALYYERAESENVINFYNRLVREVPLDEAKHRESELPCASDSLPSFDTPSLAFLLDGDLKLKDNSEYYIIISGELSERFSWLELMGE